MRKKKTEIVEIPNTTKVTGNIHKVPLGFWRRWDEGSRWIFNNMMKQAADSTLFSHPGYEKLPDDLWQTLRWNFAVNAAELLREATWISSEGKR